MNLPNPLKYQNLYFEIVEVDRDFLHVFRLFTLP